MPGRRVRVWICAGAAAWAVGFGWAQAPMREADLKAEVLLRVLLFVQWPQHRVSPAQTLELCVLEGGDLGASLLKQPQRQVGTRSVRVRRASPASLDGCHVAYVGESLPRTPPSQPVLLVSDRFGMVDKGVMVNLHTEGGVPGFDIGLGAARQAGLDISAKLLRLARYVKDE